VSTDGFSVSDRSIRAWTVLEGISSSPSVVNCILTTSGWLELFGVLVGYANFTKRWSSRIGAAKTLSRLLWDPNLGSIAGKCVNNVMQRTKLFELLVKIF
jgi:hypothetical protein